MLPRQVTLLTCAALGCAGLLSACDRNGDSEDLSGSIGTLQTL
jgi:hypothetical protein